MAVAFMSGGIEAERAERDAIRAEDQEKREAQRKQFEEFVGEGVKEADGDQNTASLYENIQHDD